MNIVQAGAIPRTAPSEIVYLPVGTHAITPTINGKPGKVTVSVPTFKGEQIAATLQASLAKRLASTVRPRLGFDHTGSGPAAAHPKSFRFDPTRGILLELEWTGSGRAAIEAGDYGYFSPTFLIDDDGTPSGLPDRGEIGSLVDEPAFRSIGLIAAADTGVEAADSDAARALVFASDGDAYLQYLSTLREGRGRHVAAADVTYDEATFNARASALVAAGNATDVDEATGIIFASEPGLYDSYLGTLTNGARAAQ